MALQLATDTDGAASEWTTAKFPRVVELSEWLIRHVESPNRTDHGEGIMMRKSKFTNEQTPNAVQEFRSGMTVAQIAKKLGVTAQTIYRWSREVHLDDCNDTSNEERIRELEEENVRLKLLVADLALDQLKHRGPVSHHQTS
jgi:putative transposase